MEWFIYRKNNIAKVARDVAKLLRWYINAAWNILSFNYYGGGMIMIRKKKKRGKGFLFYSLSVLSRDIGVYITTIFMQLEMTRSVWSNGLTSNGPYSTLAARCPNPCKTNSNLETKGLTPQKHSDAYVSGIRKER